MLKVRGESMINAGILDGDYVLVEQAQTARNGDMVVALIEDGRNSKNILQRRRDHPSAAGKMIIWIRLLFKTYRSWERSSVYSVSFKLQIIEQACFHRNFGNKLVFFHSTILLYALSLQSSYGSFLLFPLKHPQSLKWTGLSASFFVNL